VLFQCNYAFPIKCRELVISTRSAPIKVAILISTAGALAVAVLSTTVPRVSNLHCLATL
jgi:hypothetical protein